MVMSAISGPWCLGLCSWSVLGPSSVLRSSSLVCWPARPRTPRNERTKDHGRTRDHGRTKHQGPRTKDLVFIRLTHAIDDEDVDHLLLSIQLETKIADRRA